MGQLIFLNYQSRIKNSDNSSNISWKCIIEKRHKEITGTFLFNSGLLDFTRKWSKGVELTHVSSVHSTLSESVRSTLRLAYSLTKATLKNLSVPR